MSDNKTEEEELGFIGTAILSVTILLIVLWILYNTITFSVGIEDNSNWYNKNYAEEWIVRAPLNRTWQETSPCNFKRKKSDVLFPGHVMGCTVGRYVYVPFREWLNEPLFPVKEKND